MKQTQLSTTLRTRLTVLSALLFLTHGLHACTCEWVYFCEALHHETEMSVAFKGVVDRVKLYSNESRAIYVRILQSYRNDVGMPNYIKIYGASHGASCQFTIGDETWHKGDSVFMVIILGPNFQPGSHGYYNPDAISEEIWEVAPSYCLMSVLKVRHGIVRGPVAPQISEYAVTAFEDALENCSFSLEEAYRLRCTNHVFTVFPNPTPDGHITIGNQYFYSAIHTIRIYSMTGQLVSVIQMEPGPFTKTMFTLPYSGVFILAFQCAADTYYEKVVGG